MGDIDVRRLGVHVGGLPTFMLARAKDRSEPGLGCAALGLSVEGRREVLLAACTLGADAQMKQDCAISATGDGSFGEQGWDGWA